MGRLRRWQGDKPEENGTMTIYVQESDKQPGFGWRRGSGSFRWGYKGSGLVDCDKIYIHPVASLEELDELLPGWTWTELPE